MIETEYDDEEELDDEENYEDDLEELAEKVYKLWETMSLKPEGVETKLLWIKTWFACRESGHLEDTDTSQNRLTFNICMSLLDDYQCLFELYVRTAIGDTPVVD